MIDNLKKNEYCDSGYKRRDFCKTALSSVAGLTLSDAAGSNTNKRRLNIEPGIKIAEIISGMPSDEELIFLQQMGVEYIELWMYGEQISYEDIINHKRKIENAGLKLFCADAATLFHLEEFVIGLPGSGQKIKLFENFIKDLGKAGIHTTSYGWSCGYIMTTGETESRGCKTREYDYEKVNKLPNAYGRKYSEEELWDSYTVFMKRILPVAEDAGVRLALWPDDPPVLYSQGVPQIFRSNEAFTRAMEISNYSPYSGIQFCVGTWAEMPGPEGNGEDIIGAIRQFGKTGHICTVHFRNVSSPVPRFHETFVDNGYIDMYEIMKAFKDVGYDGTMVPDHVPAFTDEKRIGHMGASGNPYTIGYMKGLLQALNEETG